AFLDGEVMTAGPAWPLTEPGDRTQDGVPQWQAVRDGSGQVGHGELGGVGIGSAQSANVYLPGSGPVVDREEPHRLRENGRARGFEPAPGHETEAQQAEREEPARPGAGVQKKH